MIDQKHNALKDSLVIGFAMFAVFFGAGNLVFPPQIGLVSGEHVVPAIAGLVMTGILFPMLAVAAVGNTGSSLPEMTRHVHPKLYIGFMCVGILGVCFGTIPRCGGVAYEVGLLGIFPDLPAVSKWIFLLIFFGLSFAIASSRSKVMDNIGKFVTPLLLICLLAIVALTIINPLGNPVGGTVDNAFVNAFLTAINTGDVGTGILCAGIFISTLNAKGYKPGKAQRMMLINIIIVAFLILFVVYAGLCWLGSTGANLFAPNTDNTVLLVGLVRDLAGYTGIVVLSLSIMLATFTTSAGMIATAADWVVQISKDRFPYKLAALILTIVIMLVASTGVGFIIKLSGPLFMLMFALCASLTVLGMLKWFINDGVWKGACSMAIIVGFYQAYVVAVANGLIPQLPMLDTIFGSIPLADAGLPWLLPSVVGGIVGGIIWKVTKKESVVDEIDLLIAADKKRAAAK